MFGNDSKPKSSLAGEALQAHFGKVSIQELVTSSRTFPITSRVDLQATLEQFLTKQFKADLIGFHSQYGGHETITVAHLVRAGDYPVVVSPLQYEEVDVGEVAPARCLKNGVWLSSEKETPFAVLVSPAGRFGVGEGVHLEIAVPPGQGGLDFARKFFDDVSKQLVAVCAYRGKMLSFEISGQFTGSVSGVRVHKLSPVRRDEVVLPEKTLRLLERNVHDFIRQREKLRGAGMAAKKGLLFYGPPGTGKTHTIRYLASQLPDHTTFLVTAEHMGLLEQYFQLARHLQPAVVVIEDVDLIARSRERMRSGCEENLLNKLLNEMDGLREDASVLFVLTTNHPEELEQALASRPGRIDQAIEFPLPDDEGRKKLARLYGRNLSVPDGVAETIVRRTKNASGAFIKELMRRSAQNLFQSDTGGQLEVPHVDTALDEMLFAGGSLNLKLLGGAVQE